VKFKIQNFSKIPAIHYMVDWLSISNFSVEKLVHFFHPFFTEKVGEKFKTFSALF
jgi:NADH:ubiquinone oxidoreductase subunit E